MNFIKTAQHFLSALEKITLVFLFSLLILLSFLQVVLREFFSTGFLWADIFLRHLVLWVGFLGACIAVEQNKHFTIDVFRKLFPEKIKKAVEIVIDSFALFSLSLLSMAALKFFRDEWQTRSILFTIGTTEVPAVWIDCAIPIGFILLFVHYLLKTFEDVGQLFFSNPDEKTGSGL